jgi:hypothetical protein
LWEEGREVGRGRGGGRREVELVRDGIGVGLLRESGSHLERKEVAKVREGMRLCRAVADTPLILLSWSKRSPMQWEARRRRWKESRGRRGGESRGSRERNERLVEVVLLVVCTATNYSPEQKSGSLE